MKKIFKKYVLFISIFFAACSSNDFETNPVLPEAKQSLWPFEVFNTWSLGKDTIPNTFVIDSSFIISQTNYYNVSGLSDFLLPDFIVTDSIPATLYHDKNVIYVEIPEITKIIDEKEVKFSNFSIPIALENGNRNDLLTASTKISVTTPNETQQIDVTTTSEVTEKYTLEVLGGYVFTEVVKIKNKYTYLWQNDQYILNREIWFQPGVGPVSIIDINKSETYRIVSYQLFQSQPIN